MNLPTKHFVKGTPQNGAFAKLLFSYIFEIFLGIFFFSFLLRTKLNFKQKNKKEKLNEMG